MDFDRTRYLLIPEVAAKMRTTPHTVRKWIAAGKLRSFRPGKRRLISVEDLERFVVGQMLGTPVA